MIDCLEAECGSGTTMSLVPEILDLATAGPPDEQLTGLLMLACHRAGRPARPGVFAALRKRLAEEIGADPSADIERLHQRILATIRPSVIRRDSPPPEQRCEHPARPARAPSAAWQKPPGRATRNIGIIHNGTNC